ncbi:hypothetical protein SKAU_G00181420 [Synaphobranchus kaupii]|uniref:Kinase n=1 Tax=Synaphobranchus kaupii TaxID=118154 RepID=A0A9Q1FMU8_SYNKA|nr:hypothetical protein SKAU_G00181420 [Synaphobranchus kaupii]
MSTQHQIMDSSLALGRLEIKSPVLRSDSDYCDVSEKKVQDEPQARLNGCLPLSHQVAGHKYGVDKVGILQHPDGTVLKQLQPPPRGLREMQFYSKVHGEDPSDRCLQELQRFLPAYYGTWRSPDTPNDLYLKLEDVTQRFQKPCIMDVKIGQRSYDPFASRDKREQQINKYPLMQEIGFLVLGMRVYQVSSGTYKTYDQHYGRSLVKDALRDGLAKFFYNGDGLRKDAVTDSIRKKEGAVGVTENNNHVRELSDTRGPLVSHGDPSSGKDAAIQKQSPQVSPGPQANGNETSSRGDEEGAGPEQHGSETGRGEVEYSGDQRDDPQPPAAQKIREPRDFGWVGRDVTQHFLIHYETAAMTGSSCPGGEPEGVI